MTPRLITLSSEQRSAAGRDDDACPMHCEALHRGILTPRAMCRRAHDWRGLDRDEPSTDVSSCRPAGTGASAPIPTVRCRTARRKARGSFHPRDRDRSYVSPVTDSRAHDPKRLPLDRLLRARTPLVSKPPTPHPRAFENGRLLGIHSNRPASFRAQTGRHTPSWGRQYVRPAPIHSRSPHGHRQGCFREAPSS